MMGDASTKAEDAPKRLIGRPIQKGEVRNPKGRNQWSYRRDFEHKMRELLGGKLDEHIRNALPADVQEALGRIDEPTGNDALAIVTLMGGLDTEGKHLSEVLKRVWPATSKVEVEAPSGLDINTRHELDTSRFSDEEREEIKRLAHKALEGGGDE